MIVLRNKFYSDDDLPLNEEELAQSAEEPTRKSLKKVHSRGKGMGRAGLSIGAHVGRVAGGMKANKSDKQGKSDAEIMKDASRRGGKVGSAVGATVGLATGGALGYGAKKGLEHLADQAHAAKIDSKTLKVVGKAAAPVAKFVSNLPVIGRRYLYHPEKGKWATGRFIDRMGKAIGRGAKKAAEVENLAGKVETGLRRAAVPVAVGIGALGLAKGAIKGKRKGRSAAEKLTMDRLYKRDSSNED